MQEKIESRAQTLFSSGFKCAESVLLAIAESKGIQSELIPKIATGFCSGIARTGDTCGAVSGGILAINLMTGRNTPEVSTEANYALVREFLSQFENQHGCLTCLELIQIDLATEEGQQQYKDRNLNECCLEYVDSAARIASELLG